MFSSLVVALFAVLSLPLVAPAPVYSSFPCDLATSVPNATATPSVASPLPTDDCSDATPFTPAPPASTAASSTPALTTTPTMPIDDCSDATTAPPTSTTPSSTPTALTTTSTTPMPTDDCSDATTAPPTSTTPTSTTALSTTASSTSAAPTPSSSVASTSATSSVPVSTSSTLTTVSDASSGTYTGGYATYFYQNGNAGACGEVNSDSAFICAMDQTRFGTSGPSSPLCGRQVQITNTDTGDSITVTIADDCPTCDNENSIDLSVGAFSALAPLSEGIFPISWNYV